MSLQESKATNTEAVEWWKKQLLKANIEAADKGDVDAMCNLGNVYYYAGGAWDPMGIKQQDIEKAVGWFRKAADKDNEYAMKALINIHEEGFGVGLDLGNISTWRWKSEMLSRRRVSYLIQKLL